METSLRVVVAASLLMIAAVVLMALFTGATGTFGDTADSTTQSAQCELLEVQSDQTGDEAFDEAEDLGCEWTEDSGTDICPGHPIC